MGVDDVLEKQIQLLVNHNKIKLTDSSFLHNLNGGLCDSWGDKKILTINSRKMKCKSWRFLFVFLLFLSGPLESIIYQTAHFRMGFIALPAGQL